MINSGWANQLIPKDQDWNL